MSRRSVALAAVYLAVFTGIALLAEAAATVTFHDAGDRRVAWAIGSLATSAIVAALAPTHSTMRKDRRS